MAKLEKISSFILKLVNCLSTKLSMSKGIRQLKEDYVKLGNKSLKNSSTVTNPTILLDYSPIKICIII